MTLELCIALLANMKGIYDTLFEVFSALLQGLAPVMSEVTRKVRKCEVLVSKTVGGLESSWLHYSLLCLVGFMC